MIEQAKAESRYIQNSQTRERQDVIGGKYIKNKNGEIKVNEKN